jgi:hypothetical protein
MVCPWIPHVGELGKPKENGQMCYPGFGVRHSERSRVEDRETFWCIYIYFDTSLVQG